MLQAAAERLLQGPETVDLPTSASVRLQLEELEPRLAEAEAAATPEAAGRLGASLEALRSRADLLVERRGVLQRLETALERVAALRESLDRVRERKLLPRGSSLPGPPPYSADLLLEISERRNVLKSEIDTLKLSSEEAEEESRRARERLEEAGSLWREAREQAQLNQDPALEAELAREVEEAETRRAIARSSLALGRLRQEAARLEAERRAEELSLLESDIAFARGSARLTLSDLRSKAEAIEQARAALEEKRRRLRASSDMASKRLDEARAALDLAESEEEIDRRRAQSQYLETAQELAHRRLALLEERLDRLDAERDLWRRLRAVFTGEEQRFWNAWREEALALAAALEPGRAERLSRRADLGRRALDLRQSMQDLAGSELLWAMRRAEALESQEAFVAETSEAFEKVALLAGLLADEIARRRGSLPWSERLRLAQGWLASVWSAEVYHLDEHPVTVRKLAIALLALPFGLWLARRAAKAARRLLPGFGVSHSAAATVEKLLAYGGAAGAIAATLRLINIPLTAFAFLGGAAAIAVGFGAQNILNNFISGLILTADRPIRVGDVIEVDGVVGVVAEIGARSTRLHTFSGTNTYFPNSYLIENRVDNLLDQGRMRVSIMLCAAPGSPAREVARAIREAVASCALCSPEPPPLALFQDFTEAGYLFEVFFWIDLAPGMDYRVARSDARLAIVEMFEEKGFSLAFPRADPDEWEEDAPPLHRAPGSWSSPDPGLEKADSGPEE